MAGTDLIELRGLRVVACHGALEEEKSRAQPFEVDVELELDLSRPGATDQLSDTVDYGAVAQAVIDAVGGTHADLLEHLAERIARAALGAARSAGSAEVEAISITLRKLRPPVPADLASAGVRIRRRRQELDDAG